MLTPNQLLALIAANISGQGNQIDSGSKLPPILNGIIELITTTNDQIGELAELETDHKNNLVAAINELAGYIETMDLVVSMAQSDAERKVIYDLCAAHPSLAKNVVVVGSDGLYYPVNGYGMIDGALHLHTIMNGESGLYDVLLKIASNGTIIV